MALKFWLCYSASNGEIENGLFQKCWKIMIKNLTSKREIKYGLFWIYWNIIIKSLLQRRRWQISLWSLLFHHRLIYLCNTHHLLGLCCRLIWIRVIGNSAFHLNSTLALKNSCIRCRKHMNKFLIYEYTQIFFFFLYVFIYTSWCMPCNMKHNLPQL